MLWVGDGLVEIAALPTLVGSSTTEHLTLGHCGAAGLPWAAVSSFGTFSLVKACLGACTPCWLHYVLGVQHDGADAAIGFKLSLKGKRLQKSAYTSPVGIIHTQKNANTKTVKMEAVYKFDAGLSSLLGICSTTDSKLPVKQYMYNRDTHWKVRSASCAKRDWIVSFASLVKASEVATLWYLGAKGVHIASVMPWLFFFILAVLFQISKISRDYRGNRLREEIDIIAGELPTSQTPGGHRKVLFGAPPNIRTSLYWHFAWASGGLICLACLIITYIMLRRNSGIVVYSWFGFQLLWIALRSVIFYLSDEISDRHGHVAAITTADKAPNNFDERLMRLVTAISKYQVTCHGRGSFCYADDLQDASTIGALVKSSPVLHRISMPEGQDSASKAVNMEITAVIGDTMLSSVTWFQGLRNLHGIELYDSCLVEIKINKSKWLIPAARVTSDPDKDLSRDIENPAEPVFVARGGSTETSNKRWIYWIPFEADKWLEIKTENIHSIGKHSAVVLTEEELTARLQRGDLWISLKEAGQVHHVVQNSRTVTEQLLHLCQSF